MNVTRTWSEYLQADLAEKRKLNPRYSLRSYAKALAISPAHLSQILSGKRSVKVGSALRIASSLGLTSLETMNWLNAGIKQSGRMVSEKERIKNLTDQEFSMVSEWYYFAILGLADLKPNVAHANWIAKKLSIPVPVAQKALLNLQKYGYIKVQNGQFTQMTDPLRTQDDVPSWLVRRYHQQNLQLAAKKIEAVSVDQREFVSLTMSMNKKRIAAAKKMIRKFKEEFCDEVSKGKKDAVFNLNIQFFPLTEDL